MNKGSQTAVAVNDTAETEVTRIEYYTPDSTGRQAVKSITKVLKHQRTKTVMAKKDSTTLKNKETVNMQKKETVQRKESNKTKKGRGLMTFACVGLIVLAVCVFIIKKFI